MGVTCMELQRLYTEAPKDLQLILVHRTVHCHYVCVSVKLVANVTSYSTQRSYRGTLIFIIPPPKNRIRKIIIIKNNK
jgi:hypothetical protein